MGPLGPMGPRGETGAQGVDGLTVGYYLAYHSELEYSVISIFILSMWKDLNNLKIRFLI